MEHLIEKINALTEENVALKQTLALAVIAAGGEIVIRKHHLEEGPRAEMTMETVADALVIKAKRPGWRT